MRSILSRLDKTYTGTTLSRIAVEVGDQKDVQLLLESKLIDWNERTDGEDPAIFWALNNEKVEMVKILLKVPGIDVKLTDKNKLSLERIARYLNNKLKVLHSTIKMFIETKI